MNVLSEHRTSAHDVPACTFILNSLNISLPGRVGYAKVTLFNSTSPSIRGSAPACNVDSLQVLIEDGRAVLNRHKLLTLCMSMLGLLSIKAKTRRMAGPTFPSSGSCGVDEQGSGINPSRELATLRAGEYVPGRWQFPCPLQRKRSR